MNIVLGIYRGPHFKSIVEQEGNCAYPFEEIIDDYWIEEADGIIDAVFEAALRCDKIIFCIDNLLPNITGMEEDSYTCQELITLLSSPAIPLSKIEFRDDNKIVSLQYVQNKLNLSKELFE